MKKRNLALCAWSTASAMLLCSSLCVSALSFDLDGNDTLDRADVLRLSSALTRTATLPDGADFDASGSVNALDLVLLKQAFLSTPESGDPVTANYAATSDLMKLTGRTLRTDDVTWLVQSGCAAEFTVTGTKAELTLAGDDSVHADERYRPRYAVFVDDVLLTDALLSDEELTIPLFSGTQSRTATVKVIHLSEANNGAIGIRNLSVTSTKKSPVQPVAKKALNIEFIGDSITCAYGVEAENQNISYSTSTENFMKSYAYLTAQKLGADYSAVCYSGYGIISGYTSEDKPNTDSLVPNCYEKVGANATYSQDWDFKNNQNDVVVINLGTNDFSYVSKDVEAHSAAFTEGYLSFLAQVRAANPDAYLICTMGTMGGDEVYALIEEAVKTYQQDSGDENILSYHSTTHNGSNGYGADWHPSEVTQQLSAYVLADKICEALGMESDKIGLNAAEGGTYQLAYANGSNASAYPYLNDYDGSYWVNVSEGGEKADDLLATLSGFSLTAGTYELKFDCKTSGNAEVPFLLWSDNETLYSDTASGSEGGTTYRQTFTLEEKVEQPELRFLLGGKDYFSVTLSNVSLIKLS